MKRVIVYVALVGLDGVAAGEANREFLLGLNVDRRNESQVLLRQFEHEIHRIVIHLGISY